MKKYFKSRRLFTVLCVLCLAFTAISFEMVVVSANDNGDESTFPKWDVNQDGTVNILDLVLVGQNLGSQNLQADVNDDGTVNVLDLVLVAKHFGETTTEVVEPPKMMGPGYIYWTEYGAGAGAGKIRRANLDGSDIRDIVTGSDHPADLTLDITGGKLYWIGSTDNFNGIKRANLDGTNIEILVDGESIARSGLALDISGGKMYWGHAGPSNSNPNTSKIYRANLDGTNVETLFTGFFARFHTHVGPRGIALDLSQSKMYWTSYGDRRIQRANFDGTNVETLLNELGGPHHIALDLNSDKMYWTNWAVGTIQRANLDGSNVENLVSGQYIPGRVAPAGIALDNHNGKMYWVQFGYGTEGKIWRANLDGTDAEELVTGLTLPGGIAISIP